MKQTAKKSILVLTLVLLAIATIPFASAEEYGTINSIDTAWILIAAFLVFFMTLGFAMVESGMQRAKNASNICMKNLITPVIGGLVFFAVGFSIAFGRDISGIIGNIFNFPFLSLSE